MKNHLILIKKSLPVFFLLLMLPSLRAQSFEWTEPEFEGIDVKWHIPFMDSISPDTSVRWPFMEARYHQLYRDMLQHSDGDLVFLHETGGWLDGGYVLKKVDAATGEERWIQIIRKEHVNLNLSGGKLFETSDGNIGILGANYLREEPLPIDLNSVFRTTHQKDDGALIELIVPEDPKEAIVSLYATLSAIYLEDDNEYLIIEEIRNGFKVTKVDATLRRDRIEVLSTQDSHFRNGGVPVYGSSSNTHDITRLPNGNYVFGYSLNSNYASNINLGMLNLIVWLDPQGEIIRMVDVTEELGFALYFDIKYTDEGLLAYTSTGMLDIPSWNRHEVHATFLGYDGNILWNKELFASDDKKHSVRFTEKSGESGFLCTVSERSEHSLALYDMNTNGEFKKISDLHSTVSHHKFIPRGIQTTSNNDLILWTHIGPDTIIGGTNILTYQNRPYALKIDAKELNVSSTTDNLNEEPNFLRIFPNPAENMLNVVVQGEKSVTGQIKIVNTLGQTELTHKLETQESNFLIDISTLSSGIYHMQVWDDDKLLETQSISVLKN